jgi:ABC-type antimicrobial peptide transport system permease subunit
VGVSADVKNRGLALDPQAQVYFPFSQIPWANMNLLVRTGPDPNAMISAVRAQVAAVDSDQPVTNVQTVDELMDASRAPTRLLTSLLGVFSGIAFVLVIVGIYGVLAYSVAQRRQELGIRLALGAEKSAIFRLVVGYGLLLAGLGIMIGVASALLLGWVMASMVSGWLYQVSVRDATTFVVAPLAFLLVALLASYLPARRATQVDPNEALRGS